MTQPTLTLKQKPTPRAARTPRNLRVYSVARAFAKTAERVDNFDQHKPQIEKLTQTVDDLAGKIYGGTTRSVSVFLRKRLPPF